MGGVITYAIGAYCPLRRRRSFLQIEETEYFVRWLFVNAAEQGVDAKKIAVGGDSAGGNMARAIALKLRDENGPKLALQVPSYSQKPRLPGDTLAGRRIGQGSISKRTVPTMVRNYPQQHG